MSLAVPTVQEYRNILDRLAAEHARRKQAERTIAQLRDRLAKRSEAKPRDWSWSMYDAAELLTQLEPDPPEVIAHRRRLMLDDVDGAFADTG